MTTAVLFERDRAEVDSEWDGSVPRLGRAALFWLDLDERSERAARRAAEAFDLAEETERMLGEIGRGGRFSSHGSYAQLRVAAPTGGKEGGTDLTEVVCLVGERWVVTAHDEPAEVLDRLRDRTEGSGDVGSLNGAQFLAILLEWVLASYEDAFERLEAELEELDAEAMGPGRTDSRRGLDAIVHVRQRARRLRSSLADHREILSALAHPELEMLTSEDSAERFRTLLTRYDSTMQSARDVRDSAVGSFEVLIAQSGQRTNEIMKLLTLVSVLILPGTLLAGVMGMNFKVGLFDQANLFWAVVAVILGLSVVTLVVARGRRWI